MTVDDCLVTHPALAELIPDVRVQGIDELVLRAGARTGDRSAWWTGPGTVTGLPDDVRTGDDATITEVVAGRRFQVSARSFFQSSPEAAEALVAVVLDAIGEDGEVVDAYGGVGLFASALATDRAVTSIEVSPSSSRDARVNLAAHTATVVESPVEEWDPTRADVVVADPARQGLGPKAIEVLSATGATRFVLVSCDAAAAGRDTAGLVAAGFTHERSIVVDPFPHTAHVEIVTVLTR